MMLVVFVIMVLNSAKDNVIPRWDLGALLALSLPLLFAAIVLYTFSQVGLVTTARRGFATRWMAIACSTF